MKLLTFLLLIFCTITALAAMLPAPRAIPSTVPDSIIRNVIYGNNLNFEGNKQDLTMDIYLPPNMATGKTYPLVLMIHGGTFLTGSKENMVPICKQMADSGFVAVTINYRKGWNALSMMSGCNGVDVASLTKATYRAVQDAHAAMRYLADNAKQYHIDKNWMFIGGGSAGGVMALDVAYLNQQTADKQLADIAKTLGDLDKASNKSTAKFKIKGICNLWGALTDSTLINKQTAVPTIFFHGTADKTVPYDKGYYIPDCTRVPELYGSACLYRQTIAAGQVAILNTSIGGKHGPKEHTAAVIASNTACFFHLVMKGTAKTGAYTDAKVGCR
ncbi:alpha/beta hydrolase [Mucilaginibacter myungsuensis]|uniref:Alpha/beta hydrolase n=1 Tax=Mucilaginibacter myungsuensis TaxID=649104 RepID=A0A929KYB1_9SPHI|nr:alpha/beta hydrolase [Mucilaginibacter myungsuensis]MBE9663909.1 alpha/beta hydrolase [Mucilaginibacter myungsuensis]MDN3598375.1 alpha/beta hydrolase [Mucilaginibacter myungsuensis]